MSNPDDAAEAKSIFLDQIFLLMYYVGFTYRECYWMPVWQRLWMLDRFQREVKKYTDANDGENPPTRAFHQNTPDQRALMGRFREAPPANLRTFT